MSILPPIVFVDGNNVMGSRADGWWRNRAEAAQRLVADIGAVACRRGGTWTIVFDGPEPPTLSPVQKCLSVIHTGHRRRDGADDCIVELVAVLPDPSTVLVYTRREGRVFAVTDEDGDGRGERVREIASGLRMPSGVAFRDGALYVAAVNTILRFDDIEARLDDPPAGVLVPMVAQRYNLNANQVFRWRRLFREPAGDVGVGRFVPIVVEAARGPAK